MQHDPRVTPDGGIVLFNNFREQERSSVQILDPRTHRVIWEYTGSESRPLFSRRSGGARVLRNGNVLIVETDRGRALEVTRDREIVWEYQTPFRAGERGDRVAHIHSLERISELGWLDR